MEERKSFGNWGEDQATNYLSNHGYKIIARNYRCRYGEIDIIVSKAKELTFVEVKSRKSLIFGQPIEAVTTRKQQRIKTTAHFFLQENNTPYKRFHFDVIEILLLQGKLSINHCQDCFNY